MEEQSQNQLTEVAGKKMNDSAAKVIAKFAVPKFLQYGRNNPINGNNCFFSEATFHDILGPEPSSDERFNMQLEIAKARKKKGPKEKKERRKDLDRPADEVVVASHLDKVKISQPQSRINYDSWQHEDKSIPSLVVATDEKAGKAGPLESKLGQKNGEDSFSTKRPSEKFSYDSSSLACCKDNLGNSKYITQNKEDTSTMSFAAEVMPQGPFTRENDAFPSSLADMETSTREIKATAMYVKRELHEDNKTESELKEGDLCLVMPPDSSESDGESAVHDDHLEQDLLPSLPLIPILIDKSTKANKKTLKPEEESPKASKQVLKPQDPKILTKPDVAKLFCQGDMQSAENPSTSLSFSEPQNLAKCNDSDSECVPLFQIQQTEEQELDVPIFSLAPESPEALTQGTGEWKLGKNKGIWSPEEVKPKGKPKKQTKTDNSVKKVMEFRQSSLTREEMILYLYLFGKYVRPFIYGVRPPTIPGQHTGELAQFEALQQRVQVEQRVFQSYLQQNALKNPNFYNYIRPNARIYAFTKAKSYRLKKKAVKSFSEEFKSTVMLQNSSRHSDFTFQQRLLEIGAAPIVDLPNIKRGKNPLPIPCNMKKLEEKFPRAQKALGSEIIHHESVGFDSNAQKLAVKYGAKVVLSSSVIKCLMNNRKPSFSQPWNITVTIKDHQVEGGSHKVVYLDKPVFEGSLLMRDYNAIYHKYAFRAMVSRPNTNSSQSMKRHQSNTQGKGEGKKARTADDPFDVFATDLESLETFGQATPKTTPKSSESQRGHEKSNIQSPEFHKTLEEVSRDKDKEVDGHGVQHKGDAILRQESRGNEDIEGYNGDVKPRRSKRIAESPMANSLHLENTDCASRIKSVDHETPIKQLNSDSRSGGDEFSVRIDRSGKRSLQSPSSPHLEQGTEPEKAIKSEVTSSPGKKKRKDEMSSPQPQPDSGVKGETLQSKTRRTKKVVSLSPKSCITTAKLESRPTIGKGLSLSMPAAEGESSSLLDLILGPGGGTVDTKNKSQENPLEYIPHTEELSSLVYSLWTLSDLKLLLRTRAQGILKGKGLYMTTKMEYQTSHGLEQVTAEETIRDWTSCYIRPGTKLLRARVNAFNSQILMLEELDLHQIVKSSSDFRPDAGFSFMHSLLTELYSLDCGTYMVSHEVGADFCGIRVLKRGATLEEVHGEDPTIQLPEKNPQLTPGQVPWIPLDTNLMLPYHIMHNRIPATFLPKDVVVNKQEGKKGKKRQQNKMTSAQIAKKTKKSQNRIEKLKKRGVVGTEEFF